MCYYELMNWEGSKIRKFGLSVSQRSILKYITASLIP